MYVKTYDQMIDVLTLMKVNLPGYQTEVGATAADITWVNETLANMVYVRDFCATYDANKKASFDIKLSFFSGDKGSTVSDFPTMAAAVLPFSPLVGGAVYTLRDMAARFKLGPGYTEEIGIALGIASEGGSSLNPGLVTPTISVEAAQSGAMFSCVVSNRAESDSWTVEILRSGSSTWESAGTYTGKPADVHISLTTPGKPEQIQVRVKLRKSNAPYGNPSQAATITVNP